MWVRLTPKRLRAVDRTVEQVTDLNVALVDALWVDRVQTGIMTDVYAPYVAWRTVRDRLIDECFSSHGRRRTTVPVATVGALHAITRATGTRERHPALRGVGMLGHQAEWIPAWRVSDGWSAAPVEGARFTVLCPRWTVENGTRLTTWGEQGISPSVEDRLAREEAHLGLS